MADDPGDELNADERRALAELPMTMDPPVHLEDRVATELRARGLVRSRPGRNWRPWLAAAAVVIAFAGGWASHAWTASRGPAPDTRPRYMLLLYGAESTTAAEETGRVNEYRAWAGTVAAGGAHVSGEKLDDRAIVLGPGPEATADAQRLGGVFIISAQDDGAAEALTRTHPHLKHGGRILIRPIVSH